MVKKLKAMADMKSASGAKLFDSALAGSVKDSAQQIWLAGMGAFSKAQAEGRQVFETLVKEGTSLQKKTQSAAEERLGDVTTKMSSMAGDVSAKAGQQWDKLESIFEERTAKALKRLGEPRTITLAMPPYGCSTPAVYAAWDSLGGPTADGLNDLEPAALVVEPRMAAFRDAFGDATGLTPQLAGSGSTWFVEGEFPGEGRIVTRTIPAYW